MYTSENFRHGNSRVERRFLRLLKLTSHMMQNDFPKMYWNIESAFTCN